jgi:hypothetical protein
VHYDRELAGDRKLTDVQWELIAPMIPDARTGAAA